LIPHRDRPLRFSTGRQIVFTVLNTRGGGAEAEHSILAGTGQDLNTDQGYGKDGGVAEAAIDGQHEGFGNRSGGVQRLAQLVHHGGEQLREVVPLFGGAILLPLLLRGLARRARPVLRRPVSPTPMPT
jgi:hypothetical protein